MLKKLRLENFRCFERTTISFRELSIIVGKNNAGKSTLIEALRILSLIVTRCKNINYSPAPSWVTLNDDTLGISPSLSNLDISAAGIIYMYNEGPAKIIGEFENGVKIVIYISYDLEVFATIKNKVGLNVESKRFAISLGLKELNILPQISPLLKNETVIKYETVLKNIPTYLSSRNFRNQLNYFSSEFERFKILAEKTWPGLRIDGDSKNIRTQGSLYLYVRNNNFQAEIGLMGHGLQMWLQTMWFLARCSNESTVILDEPDVYMHADLQRRLIKIIKDRFDQVIVATHSVEIMSEVEAENILPIDSSKHKQEYANQAPIVQQVIEGIGSVHNIEIARIFSHNKFLVVEGDKDDIKLLSIFHSKLFPNTFDQLDVLPKIYVEGWGGWQRVIGSNKVFKENKSSIKTYCIFDSDYHIDKEKGDRYADARANDINLHIWNKKEIENYLIVPAAFVRLIKKGNRNANITVQNVIDRVNEFCETLKEEIIDNFANEIRNHNKSLDIKKINGMARNHVKSKWESDKWSMVPGKAVIKELFSWVSKEFKISSNIFSIAREISVSEIEAEICDVLTSIEANKDFS